jgi:hypothetical protein
MEANFVSSFSLTNNMHIAQLWTQTLSLMYHSQAFADSVLVGK